MKPFDPSAMLAFDLETTSADPWEARIVTSAMVSITANSATPVELLADPGVDIPAAATEVHGISTEYAKEHGRPHQEVLAKTVDSLFDAWEQGQSVVVYNAPYDLTVLRQLTGDFVVGGLVVDPYIIDRAKDPYRKGRRTLTALCEHYGVRLDNAHEATADATAAARLAWKMARVWPELTQLSGEELMEKQAVWFHQAQESLRRYRASQGKTGHINTSWPMIGSRA